MRTLGSLAAALVAVVLLAGCSSSHRAQQRSSHARPLPPAQTFVAWGTSKDFPPGVLTPDRVVSCGGHGVSISAKVPSNGSADRGRGQVSPTGTTSSVSISIRVAPGGVVIVRCPRQPPPALGNPRRHVAGSELGQTEIVFAAYRPRPSCLKNSCQFPPANLYSISAPGGHLRRITKTSQDETGPSLSPDGRVIAFSGAQFNSSSSACEGPGCLSEIWLVRNAAGAHARRLTHPLGPYGGDDEPSWSPDGKAILFTRASADAASGVSPGGVYSYITGATGGRIRKAIFPAGAVWGPNNRIAYSKGGIWTVNPDGSEAKKIAGGGDDSELAWSRVGQLAYDELRITQNPYKAHNYVQVIGKTKHSFQLPFVHVSGLAWSRDGRRLFVAGSSARSGLDAALYAVDTNGHGLTKLVSHVGYIEGITSR